MKSVEIEFSDEIVAKWVESWRSHFEYNDQEKMLHSVLREEYLIKNALEKHLGREADQTDAIFTTKVYIDGSNDYHLFYKSIELGKMRVEFLSKNRVWFDFLELNKKD